MQDVTPAAAQSAVEHSQRIIGTVWECRFRPSFTACHDGELKKCSVVNCKTSPKSKVEQWDGLKDLELAINGAFSHTVPKNSFEEVTA